MPNIVEPLSGEAPASISLPTDAPIQNMGLKAWEPKRLSQRHKQCCALKATGLRQKEIAEMTGYSESRVSVILNDPRSVALINQISSKIVENVVEETGEFIKGHTLEAAQIVVELMRSAESEPVRLSAAKDNLDRGGFKPKERLQVDADPIDPKDIGHLAATLREGRIEVVPLDMVEDSSGVFQVDDAATSARKK